MARRRDTKGPFQRGPFPSERRDRLIQEHEHDPYQVREKLPDPTVCPECEATYREGRWTWAPAPADAHQALCGACERVRDDFPAGYLTLSGSFLEEHRDELLGLARNIEEDQKGEHPLKRIMAIREEDGEIVITTTDPELARSIGDGLFRAYEGELDYGYEKGENLLRVAWHR